MIKIDMEMPKSCCECPCIDMYGFCPLIKVYVDWDERNCEKPDNCPLIEVKE